MREVKEILDEAQEKMDMAVMYLEEALAHIRAGKADVRLLDGIRVDSYGSMVPINNVAAVNTPDARSIVIKPWDKSMFRVIEKAIIDSSLGIMPNQTIVCLSMFLVYKVNVVGANKFDIVFLGKLYQLGIRPLL